MKAANLIFSSWWEASQFTLSKSVAVVGVVVSLATKEKAEHSLLGCCGN